MADTGDDTTGTGRRALFAGAGLVGLAATISACGSSNSGSGDTATGDGGDPSSGPLAKTTDIPVQGGKIYPDEGIVVTQPVAGQYKGFTATCPHQGCTVGSIADQLIRCPCHGSQFSITDGSVQNGPATRPLAPRAITVANGEITLG